MNEELLSEELVSAIIITYNRPLEILKRSVDSVLSQTYTNLELIVVNDYPEGEELNQLIAEYLSSLNDSRIKYVVHPINKGACAARNTGILQSKGKYIACLDDDDEWLPQKIESQLQGFRDAEVGLVYSPFNLYDRKNKGIIIRRGSESGNILQLLLEKNFLGGTSMTMFTAEAINKCGLFDEQLLSSQDYDLWLRIAIQYKVSFIDTPLTNRYLLDESITNNYFKRKSGFEYFMNKHQDLFLENKKAYMYQLTRMINTSFSVGEFKYGFNLWKKVFKAYPWSHEFFTEPLKGILKRIFPSHRENFTSTSL